MKLTAEKLTKDDTRALWYAVEAQHEMLRAMRGEGFTSEQMEAEPAAVLAARRALCKVNAIRKAQSCRSTANPQVLQAEPKTAGGAGT